MMSVHPSSVIAWKMSKKATGTLSKEMRPKCGLPERSACCGASGSAVRGRGWQVGGEQVASRWQAGGMWIGGKWVACVWQGARREQAASAQQEAAQPACEFQ